MKELQAEEAGMKIELDASKTSSRFVALLAAVVIAVPLAFVVVPAAAAALIGTADIQNRAVTSAKIARGAVQVKNVRKPVIHEVGAAGQVPYAGGMRAYNGSPFGNLSYYKDATGVVHLTGLACEDSGTGCTSGISLSGTQFIFTLPAGFRPSRQLVFTTLSAAGANYFHTRIDVTTDGVVKMVAPPTGGGDWVSLDGVSFLAD